MSDETKNMVYKYGLLAPTRNGDVVEQQMRAAHQYRNALVELERTRRDQLHAIVEPEVQQELADLRAAQQRCDETRAAVAQANQQQHSRAKADPQLKQLYEEAQEQRKAAGAALRAARRASYKRHKAELQRITDQHKEAVKIERAKTDTYWGTYNLVEDAMKASSGDKTLYRKDLLEPEYPRFQRWRQEGRVGAQIQKDPQDKRNGLATEHVFEPNTLFWVDPVDERAWYDPKRSVRRRFSRTKLHLRIKSDGRDPVWAEWPMIMHRPLPENARIKYAVVHRKRIGPRDRWSVDFVLDTTLCRQPQNDAVGDVGIDLGWRVLDQGIRVAAWDGHDGDTGYVVLDQTLLSALRYHRNLKSIRSTNFNEILARLVQHFRQHEMPEWIRCLTGKKNEDPSGAEACLYLSKWKSEARLTRLTKQWATEGIEPIHQAMYDELEAWRYHDHHLWRWERDQQTKSQLRRREQYRIFAAQLARRYRTLSLEDFNLSRVAQRGDVDTAYENETAKSNRQLVAVHELRSALVNAFQRSGEVRIVVARNTTRDCHVCGVTNHWDQQQDLEHRCVACGALWDQDDNAARNIRLSQELAPERKRRKRPSRSKRKLHQG